MGKMRNWAFCIMLVFVAICKMSPSLGNFHNAIIPNFFNLRPPLAFLEISRPPFPKYSRFNLLNLTKRTERRTFKGFKLNEMNKRQGLPKRQLNELNERTNERAEQ